MLLRKSINQEICFIRDRAGILLGDGRPIWRDRRNEWQWSISFLDGEVTICIKKLEEAKIPVEMMLILK